MRNAMELAAGILLLYLGAEWLVKGAAGLGRAMRVRPLIIGLTVVAYGTSMPEFVVSTAATLRGSTGLALGNVVGSNIANFGLILGTTAFIRPLMVEGGLIRRELPLILLTSLALPILLADSVVSRLEGGLLLAGAAGFTWLAARSALPARTEMAAMETDAEAAGAPSGGGLRRLALIAAAGLALLAVGGEAFVSGASGLAIRFGISERVVGLTVAAVGTSAPELAASIVAALRGHASIAVGNVLGSNIFNILFVLGAVAAIHPIAGSLAAFGFDLAVMAAISLIVCLLLRRPRLLRRWEGVLLLGLYFAYLAAIVVTA